MNTQQALFDDLGRAIDSWTDVVRKLIDDPDPDLIWSEHPEALQRLREIIRETQSGEDLEQLVSEVIQGVIHSVLVMLDGGSKLAETTNLTVTDDSGQELPRYLHELFGSYLSETNRL